MSSEEGFQEPTTSKWTTTTRIRELNATEWPPDGRAWSCAPPPISTSGDSREVRTHGTDHHLALRMEDASEQ